MERKWWKEAVFYQIYPRSFYDSNGDGNGDLKGITEKLPYLKELGITALWICPFYQSPMVDNGYDISDYYGINPMFGTMDDARELLTVANQNGIRVILDLVLNHTSDQHPWFRAACADKNSRYRDYYIFREDGRDLANLRSNFGGSAWTQIADGSWYFHTFAKEQPDLNWENPAMRRELYTMINWWLDQGASGFRLDAITYIKKDMTFPPVEADGVDGLCDVGKQCLNVPGIEKYLTEMRQETYGRGDFMTVAEAPGVPPEQLEVYIGENGFFSMIFDFSYTDIDLTQGEPWIRPSDWTVKEFKEKLFRNQRRVSETGWAANNLENHDQPRSIDKYFSRIVVENGEKGVSFEQYADTMAKALGTLFFFLRGTPFIYQGEELGMRNTVVSSIDDVEDVHSIGQYERAILEGYPEAEALAAVNARSREEAMLPMQWNGEDFYGFSVTEPWIACNNSCEAQTVERESADAQSVLSYYKKMIRLRNHSPYSETLIYGEIEEVASAPDVICYKRIGQREEIYVAVNMSGDDVPFGETPNRLLGNYEGFSDRTEKAGEEDINKILQPFEAVVWMEKRQ
ncbi:MAG: alpha-glucosidase [Lachnospiraceae bacterium]|nr:alpha-glucosidase [Lachnospiraceae bacterium]